MQRPSHLFKDIMKILGGGAITMGDLVEKLGDRSFTLVILLLSLPNALPLPGIPGVSTVTGLPILFMATQILLGRKKIWLPKSWMQKRFSCERMARIVAKALPMILWFEKFLHPRLMVLTESVGQRVLALLMIIMAFILILPVLGGNFFPGFAIFLLALALLEEDGVLALFGILFSLVSLYLMASIVMIAGNGVMEWVSG